MKAPHDLRARVQNDLRPVRPLMPPWLRLALLAPAVALACAATPAVFGFRSDFAAIGPFLAWGGSLVQLIVALLLIAAALREAVPADAVSSSSARLLLASAIVLAAALAVATNTVSPEPARRTETFEAWWFCWEGVVLAGAPLLLLLIVLLARGLPMRPALAGALAGMGAGAAVDGGWRLYCEYSNPSHVLGSHGGGVLALTFAGIVLGKVIARVTHGRGRRGR